MTIHGIGRQLRQVLQDVAAQRVLARNRQAAAHDIV